MATWKEYLTENKDEYKSGQEIPYTKKTLKNLIVAGIPIKVIGVGGGYADTIEWGRDIDQKSIDRMNSKGVSFVDSIVNDADNTLKHSSGGIKNRKKMIVVK